MGPDQLSGVLKITLTARTPLLIGEFSRRGPDGAEQRACDLASQLNRTKMVEYLSFTESFGDYDAQKSPSSQNTPRKGRLCNTFRSRHRDKLAGLTVRDVDFTLGKLAKRLSTRSVRLARMILIQAIRNAIGLHASCAIRSCLTPASPSSRSRTRSVGYSSTRTTEVVHRHPAPAGYAHGDRGAGPAVRAQRDDQRRPELTR
jgi:hypothetical protein